jgi:hypothetical protein
MPSAAEESSALATYALLQKSLSENLKLKISEIFLAGSLGKGTRIREESELEIVVVLNEFDAKNCTWLSTHLSTVSLFVHPTFDRWGILQTCRGMPRCTRFRFSPHTVVAPILCQG